jgi:prophage regulatory protein
METPKKFLRRGKVEERTGLPASTLYELIAKNAFPKQVKISPRIVVWLEDEIDAWMAAQVGTRADGRKVTEAA